MPAKIRTEKISAGWMEPISHSAKAAKNAAVIRVIPGFWNEIIFVIRWESSWKGFSLVSVREKSKKITRKMEHLHFLDMKWGQWYI